MHSGSRSSDREGECSNMSETKEYKEGPKVCKDTGLPTHSCPCLDCDPIRFDIVSLLVEARDLEDILAHLSTAYQFLNKLRAMGFGVEVDRDGWGMRLNEPLLEMIYWMKCQGCYAPLLVEDGIKIENPTVLCEDCKEVRRSHVGERSRYYSDLFDFLAMMFDKMEEGGPGPRENLGFTREFCERFDFDFELVKARLERTSGYCDAEALMNSMMYIPMFDSLPTLKHKEVEE